MYNGKQNNWSSEKAKRRVFFYPGRRRYGTVEAEVERGMIRVANLDLVGFFEEYVRENCRLCRIRSFFARR